MASNRHSGNGRDLGISRQSPRSDKSYKSSMSDSEQKENHDTDGGRRLSLRSNGLATARAQEDMLRKSLKMRQEVLGMRHADTATAMADLARNFVASGKHEQAQHLMAEVLDLRRDILGSRHADTIAIAADLARELCHAGRYEEALELQTQVRQIRREMLGPKHPKRVAAAADMARTWCELERFEEAQQLQTENLEFMTEIFGPENPQTIVAMADLAWTLHKRGQHEDAEKHQAEVTKLRENVLGERHPDTIIAMANLAHMWHKQARYSEAEKLQAQILELKKEICGGEHPDTFAAAAELASTWHRLGKHEEAAQLQQQVLAKRTKTLGLEHRSTIEAAHYLASSLQQLGRYDETETLLQQFIDVLAPAGRDDEAQAFQSLLEELRSTLDKTTGITATGIDLNSSSLMLHHRTKAHEVSLDTVSTVDKADKHPDIGETEATPRTQKGRAYSTTHSSNNGAPKPPLVPTYLTQSYPSSSPSLVIDDRLQDRIRRLRLSNSSSHSRSIRRSSHLPNTATGYAETHLLINLCPFPLRQGEHNTRTRSARVVSKFISNICLILMTAVFGGAALITLGAAFQLGMQEKDPEYDAPHWLPTWVNSGFIYCVSEGLFLILGVYMTLVPLLAHTRQCRQHRRWRWLCVWISASASCAFAVSSMPVYRYSEAGSSLLGGLGNAAQVFVIFLSMLIVNEKELLDDKQQALPSVERRPSEV